jgi:galactokinase
LSAELFARTYGRAPEVTASAPARANLLGEHTDYNNGFVFPAPLPFRTSVSLARTAGPDGAVEAVSANFAGRLKHAPGAPAAHHWADYVAGCVEILRGEGFAIPALQVAVAGDVPMGAGISSSAALEVATMRALNDLLGLGLDGRRIATLGQKAENQFVGMPCGIMDQMVSSLGEPGQALFLDTMTLATELVPLPADYIIAIIHSGVAHRLVDGGYKQRRQQCEEACALLGIGSLRELGVADLPRLDALPDILRRRARHIINDNQYVLDGIAALKAKDYKRFGELMTLSHQSEKDDYGITIEETDKLAEDAVTFGALGARQTGGGFGGCVLALVAAEKAADWWAGMAPRHPIARLIYPVAT